MAGGRRAVFRSIEGAEDDARAGARAIRRRARRGDAVVGIAASGVTPFVRAALVEARRRGALTVLVTCNPSAPRGAARIGIALRVGPEVLAGSTRLKARTATKLALNTLTTATFTRLGKVRQSDGGSPAALGKLRARAERDRRARASQRGARAPAPRSGGRQRQGCHRDGAAPHQRRRSARRQGAGGFLGAPRI
jgi:N-acetylmuramic acid 6-phosphate etherase